MAKKFLWTALLSIVCGVLFVCTAVAPVPLPQRMNSVPLSITASLPLVIAQDYELTPLEKALAATVRVSWRESGMGTGTLVGKRPLPEVNMTQYFVLTAYHVASLVPPESLNAGIVDCAVHAWIDPNVPPQLLTQEVEVIVSLPAKDILIVSFDSEKDLQLAQLSQPGYVAISMHVGDDLYIAGCDGGVFPLMRKGILGSKIYISWPRPFGTIIQQNPTEYFCPSASTWYGASGGAVFNKDAEYIGMPVVIQLGWMTVERQVTDVFGLAVTVSERIKAPINHIPTALKLDAIRAHLAEANASYVLESQEK